MYKQLTELLSGAFVLQIATSVSDKPWVCTVYFVYDDNLNLYWLSEPQRRHSLEIEKNPSVAVTMAIKTDLPVIGLGAEGVAELEKDYSVVELIMKKYVKKYNSGTKFLENYKKGINKHQLYKFIPKKYILFDEVNYSKNKSIDFTI